MAGLGLIAVIALCVYIRSVAYRRGFEAGCRYQRRIINQAVDKINGQRLSAERDSDTKRLAAERDIDYLYERTRGHIREVDPSQ